MVVSYYQWSIAANVKMKKCQYKVNKWSIDLSTGFITHQETGEQKRLGEYQLKLLTVLLQHTGQILTRDELTDLVWKRRVIGNNSLPNAIHTLRVALGDDKKQQRIIQTIPKIGYLLDATYCEVIELDEEPFIQNNNVILDDQLIAHQESPDNSSPGLPAVGADNTEEQPATAANSSEEFDTLDKQTVEGAVGHTAKTAYGLSEERHSSTMLALSKPQKRIKSNRLKILISSLSIVALGGGIALYLAVQQNTATTYHATELGAGTYSNIRMYQITDNRFDKKNADDLYARIKDTLYKTDKDLKTKQAHLQVYYHISLRRLDYTISVETRCDKKQLNMTIYHWRQDDNLLNNVIYNETERKINEIPAC